MTEIFRLRRADLAFPSRAAKQGRGNESVSGGDREPRLTEPQRDSCRRSRRMRCSAAARLCRQMLHFASLTEILSLRYRLSVFLSRRKKNSEKERPLRGFRREVRFIVSPPGKRRHNELNAAPPPETPRETGKPGATPDRDNAHSGESFCVRAKTVRQLSARHDFAALFFGFCACRKVILPIKNFFQYASLLLSFKESRRSFFLSNS